MSDWISVKDGLPAFDVDVWVALDRSRHTWWFDIGVYDENRGWVNAEYRKLAVTHWMPLPNPPEVKDE